jgi:hypothetical protein
MRTALPLAALILCTPVSLAQMAGVPTTMNSFLPIGEASGTPYGRATVLDADRDSLEDIFFLHGTEIEGVFAPGVFMSFYDWISTGDDNYDVACLPDGAISGADALLSVGSSGLLSRELVLNENNGSWSWSATTLENSWADAKRLDCRVLAGETWIFGLQTNGVQPNLRTMRARAEIGSGWTEGALFTTTFDVTEIGAMDYQGDGTLEVAVIGGSRWEIWSRNGSAFDPWTRAASGVQSGFTLLDLAVGAQSGNSAEWVAFLASNNETPDRSCLIVRDSAGTQTPEEISGQPDAIAVEAGDLNGDGHDDLVLSIRADAAMLVAVNQSTGSSPAFDGARTATPPAEPPTLTFEIPIVTDDFELNGAHPIVADFDNDFDLDFCLPLEPPGYAEAMLFVHRDPLGTEELLPPLSLSANACEGISVQDQDLSQCTPTQSRLMLPICANKTAPDNVESFLWSKPVGQTYTLPNSTCWASVSNSTQCPLTGLDLVLGTNPGSIEPGSERDGTIYYFMVCYAELNSSGGVARILYPQVYGFETLCEYGDTCAPQVLLSDYASGPTFKVNSSDCENPPDVNCIPFEEGPGIWTGTSVPVPCIPQLPPNQPPQLVRSACGS